MLQQKFCFLLTQAMNQLIALNESRQYLLHALSCKTLELNIAPFGFQLFFQFDENGVQCLSETACASDTILSGRFSSFIKLAFLSIADVRALFQEAITLEGSAEVGENVKRLFDVSSVDWEGKLSTLIGDPLAFQVGNAIRGGLAFQNKIKTAFCSELGIFLTQETQSLPSKAEHEGFKNDVETLSDDVARLEAWMRHEGVL